MTEVWSRLEERVPREVIKYEIISHFRNLKSLPSKKTPTILLNQLRYVHVPIVKLLNPHLSNMFGRPRVLTKMDEYALRCLGNRDIRSDYRIIMSWLKIR